MCASCTVGLNCAFWRGRQKKANQRWRILHRGVCYRRGDEIVGVMVIYSATKLSVSADKTTIPSNKVLRQLTGAWRANWKKPIVTSC